jgi:hypothetical protein
MQPSRHNSTDSQVRRQYKRQIDVGPMPQAFQTLSNGIISEVEEPDPQTKDI